MKTYTHTFLCLFISATQLSAAPDPNKVIATRDIVLLEKKDKALFFIKELRKTQLTKASTTSKRIERKTVISETIFQDALQDLYAHQDANFSRRDHLQEGQKNKTFTFYGASIAFRQKNLKTKIKLRARFYLKINKHGKTIRSDPRFGFLELKIKNPLPGQKGVHKYRLKLHDDLLFKVFTIPPHTTEFHELLQHIKQSISASHKEYKTSLIMLDAIKYFSNIDSRFSQPVLGVSYTRDSYQQDILSNNIQITIDHNVQAYLPYNIEHLQGFNHYLTEDGAEQDLVYSYPNDVVVLELKEPIQVSQEKKFKKGSLLEKVRLFRQYAFCRAYVSYGFDIERNRGKAGTIRNLLYKTYL